MAKWKVPVIIDEIDEFDRIKKYSRNSKQQSEKYFY